jgi:hypothetical protein
MPHLRGEGKKIPSVAKIPRNAEVKGATEKIVFKRQ